MTYKKVQDAYKQQHGKAVETCWIADIKRKSGVPMKNAPNRQGAIPTKPCPDDVYPKLKAIMVKCGMI